MQTATSPPTYVFVSVSPSRMKRVIDELKQDSQIDLIAPVTGRFDLALRLKPSTSEEAYQQSKQIRAIEGVRTASVHMAHKGFQNDKKPDRHKALGITLLDFGGSPPDNTLKQLSNTRGVVEAFSVPETQFDIVALWQAKAPEEIMKISTEKLVNLPGLYKIETFLSCASYSRT